MNQERVTHEVVENDEITIDLTELFAVLWARACVGCVGGLVVGLVAVGGRRRFMTPE